MKKFHLSNATKAKLAVLLLAGTTVFTSCQNKPESQTDTGYSEIIKKPITSLDQITPTYRYRDWHGEPYLTIDENSLEQIINLAMENAKNFYIDIGAESMKLNKNLNYIEDTQDFYIDWMNTEFFKARAMQESGDIFMVNFRGGVKTDFREDPCGIMQIDFNEVVPTLEQYYRDIFNQNINLDNLEVFPTDYDICNYQNKQSNKNITETVYNNIYLSICYDIYKAKCLHPGHTDYYDSYGGYNEDLRRQATIASYLFGNDVVTSMQNGTFYEKYSNTEYVRNITNFQKNFENQKYNNDYQFGN